MLSSFLLSAATTNAQEIIQVTANRSLLDSAITSNNISLSTEKIELNNHQHLNQLLSQVSGVWLSRGNGQESLLSLRSPVFTGPAACNEFLLMQDGIALRAPGFCNVNELFDSTAELAGQIDVVKGAHSAQYGPSAIHGLINIKSPRLTNDATTASLTLGPDGYIKLNSQYAQTQDTPTYFGMSLGHDGGYQHSSGYDQQKLLFKNQLDFNQLSINNQISVTHLSQQTAGYLQQGKDAFKNAALTRNNSIPDAYRHTTAINAHSKISSVKENYSWAITPYIRWNEMQFLMHYLPGEPTEKNGHQSIGTQAQLQYRLDKSIVTVGTDVDITHGFLKQYQKSETDSGSDFLDMILPAGQQYDYQVKARNIALYSGIEHSISKPLTLSANIRWDTVRYDYENKMLTGNSKDDGSACGGPGCRYTRPADSSDQFDNLSWNGQLNYQLSPQSDTYLKIDHAFRAPHTSELYRLQNGQLETQIDSEQANSIELGYQFIEQATRLKLAIYQMHKSDVIFRDSQRNYVNDAKMRHTGIELDLNQTLSPQLSAEFNLSWAEHIYKNNPNLVNSDESLAGNKIDTAPELTAAARFNWFYLADSLVQLEYQHMSDYFLNPENTAEYEGHNLINLRWQHQLNTQWKLGLQWLNALNTAYAERADFAFGNYRYFVGQPSRVYLKVSYDFN